MLTTKKEGDQILIVNDDGSKSFPVSEKAWKALSDPEILMDDFKRAIQSYTLETNRDWAFPEMKYAEEPSYPDRYDCVDSCDGGIYALHYQIDWTPELLANIEQAGIFPAIIPGCTNASWHDPVNFVTQISIINCSQPLDISAGPLTTGILGIVSYADAELDLTIPITTKNTIALREDGTLAKRPKRGLSSITIAEALPE